MVLACLHGNCAATRVARHALMFGCLALLLAGCQGGPRTYAYIETMNAERRGLEDRVYELEYELEMLGSEVDHYREENARLRRQMNGESSASERPSGPSNNSLPAPRPFRAPPRSSAPPRSLPPDDLAPPRIDTGDPDAEMSAPNGPDNSTQRPPSDENRGGPPANEPPANEPPANDPGANDPGANGPPNERASGDDADRDAGVEDDAESLQGPTLNQSSYREDRQTGAANSDGLGPDDVASVALDPRLTGGVDLDDAAGDDGVTVAIELRDTRGRLVSETGPVSVVVVDPQLAGPAARVARWDLDADQVSRLLPDRRDGQSMVLHMAWPTSPPSNKHLRLFVRYLTADGRKLDAQRDIEIRLPADSRQTRAIPATPARPLSRSTESSPEIRQASGQQPLIGQSSDGNADRAGWRARAKN